MLLGVDLEVRAGERIAIMGRSGSGKSTLLHLLGGLDVPSEGTVTLQGKALSEMARSRARRHAATARSASSTSSTTCCRNSPREENVAMPLLDPAHGPRRRACEGARRPRGSSAWPTDANICRASSPAASASAARSRARMVTEPACVLADEPTGNLDAQTADEVFEAMVRLSDSRGTAFVLVTHDAALAARTGRVLELTRTCSDGAAGRPSPLAAIAASSSRRVRANCSRSSLDIETCASGSLRCTA